MNALANAVSRTLIVAVRTTCYICDYITLVALKVMIRGTGYGIRTG